MFTSEALHSVWFALLERPFADWLSTPRMRSATQRPGTAQSEIMTVGSTYRLRARFACHEVDVARDLDVVQQRLLFRLVFSLGKQRLIDPFRTHVRSLITGIATTQPPAHLLRRVPIFHHFPDHGAQTWIGINLALFRSKPTQHRFTVVASTSVVYLLPG